MDYLIFETRAAARAEAQYMRRHGWPEATAVRIVDWDGHPVWVVRATRNRAGDCTWLRRDGYVR